MPIRPRTPARSAPSSLLRHWSLWAWFALALIFCVGGVAAWKSGRWLVREDNFDHVGWALVLAGESRDCERSEKAIELYKAGRVDSLILSATRIFKNRYQSEFMVDYFVQQGVPRDRVFEFRQEAYSTQEEARMLVRQFRLQNLDTVLIITSNFHTARTRRIFRKLSQGYPVILVASADFLPFDPNAWWSNREGMKHWFNEWVKTVFTFYELWKAEPETGKADFQGLTPDIWATGGEGGGQAMPEATPEDSGRGAEGALDSGSAGDADQEGEIGNPDSLGSGSSPGDSTKDHKDSLKAVDVDAKSEAKASKDSAAQVKSSLAAKLAAEASRTAVEPKSESKTSKDTEARKSLPRAAKKPTGTASKSTAKKSEKPEKSEKPKSK